MKDRDRYLKIVEWSEEDQCYVGSAPGLIGPCCHGDDEQSVYRQLCGIVDEWIAIHREDDRPLPEATAGKVYSGKFLVRVGSDLHKALTLLALRKGQSLNSLCRDLLDQAVR